MLVEFLYRYYYTFFVKHLKDEELGRTGGPAWAHTMLQITAGIGLLMSGVFLLLLYYLELFDYSKRLNKVYSILFILVLPFLVLYFLLFRYYQVSKKTGKTPRSDYKISKGWNLFFWLFWIFSVIFPFLIGLICNGLL